jgi:hypothetical protein
MRALSCEIFRWSLGDCSNHGISERHKEVLVVCPDGPIEIDESNLPDNLCKVVKRDLGFTEYVCVEPYAEAKGAGWMYGGTIIDTSDSRFNRLTGIDYPLHFHDRDETWEQYEMLSR